MNQNQNPNFDFYSFNNEQSAADEKAPGTPVDEVSLAVDSAMRKDEIKTARHSFSVLGFGMIALLAGALLASYGINWLVTTYFPAFVGTTGFDLLSSTIPLYVFGFVPFFLIVRKLPLAKPEKERFGAGRWLLIFMMSIAVMVVGNIIGRIVMNFLGTLTGYTYEGILNFMVEGPLWETFLLSVVLAPIMEELIFRKLLIDRMRPYGEGLAILVSALFFGLFHGNFYQFFYAFGMGVLFGYVYLRGGKIWLTMLLHAVCNFFGGFVVTAISGLIDMEAFEAAAMGTQEEILAFFQENILGIATLLLYEFLFYGLAIAGLVLLLVFFRKRRLEPVPGALPRGQRGVAFVNVGVLLSIAVLAADFIRVMIVVAEPLFTV